MHYKNLNEDVSIGVFLWISDNLGMKNEEVRKAWNRSLVNICYSRPSLKIVLSKCPRNYERLLRNCYGKHYTYMGQPKVGMTWSVYRCFEFNELRQCVVLLNLSIVLCPFQFFITYLMDGLDWQGILIRLSLITLSLTSFYWICKLDALKQSCSL